MIRKVELSKTAMKQLRKVPGFIVRKLAGWTGYVETNGLYEARKIPGYHDEPLRGNREGQRSIRLSKGYRAIYVIKEKGTVEFVYIEEVTKHAY